MATLSLGAVAGGNNTEPPINFTLVNPNTLMPSQYYYNETSMIKYVSGDTWVWCNAYQWPGGTERGLWYTDTVTGNNWIGFDPPSGSAQQINLFHYNPTQGKYYIGENNNPSLWVSTQLSKNFTNVSAVYNGGNGYVVTGADNNGTRTVFVARKKSNDGVGRAWRTDDGVTFTQLDWGGNEFGACTHVKYVGNNTWIALSAYLHGLIYRSTDNGVTWTRSISIAYQGAGLRFSGIAANGTGTVVTFDPHNAKIYTSQDYGATWTNTYTYATNYSTYSVTINPGNQYPNAYPQTFIYHPQQDCFVFLNRADTMLVSNSNGTSWTMNTDLTTAKIGNSVVGVMDVNPNNGLIVVAASKYTGNSAYDGSYVNKSLAYGNNPKQL